MPITRQDDLIIVQQKKYIHSATVVILHGLGDTGEGFVDIAESFTVQFQHIKFILVTAKSIPVTLYGKTSVNAWYDITGLTEEHSQNIAGIDVSVSRIKAVLEEEHSLGLPYSRMMLMGFSQGAALSLFCGLQLSKAHCLAGIISIAGYMPGTNKFKLTEGLENLPILHLHGHSDDVIHYEWALMTKEYLLSKGAKSYRLVSFEGIKHSISLSMLDACVEFFKAHISQDERYIIKPKPFNEMSVKELKQALREANIANKAVGFNEKCEFVALLESHYAALLKS